MEPITGVEKISKQRWKLVRRMDILLRNNLSLGIQKCSICDIREGACIQCAKTSCFLAFHTTCAHKERLLMPMKGTQGSEVVSLTCYCEKHLPVCSIFGFLRTFLWLIQIERLPRESSRKLARPRSKPKNLGIGMETPSHQSLLELTLKPINWGHRLCPL